MKIKLRLTLEYSMLTALLMLATMFVIYAHSEKSRKSTFIQELQREAITKAQLFLNGDSTPETMHRIYDNNRQFIDEVQVAVYEKPFTLIYHDAGNIDLLKEDTLMFRNMAEAGGVMNLNVGEYEAVIMDYSFEGKDYVLTAVAYDGNGRENIAALKRLLIAVSVICFTIIVISGFLFAYVALKPINRLLEEAEQITASSMDKRLPLNSNHDEIYELSATFNSLFDRLEKAFNSQKMFVSNASHELRTPVAAMKAEMEILLMKDRTTEEYRHAIENMLNDAQRLTQLIDGLLKLAKADYNAESIKFEELRVDELLIDSVQHVRKLHPDYKVDVIFQEDIEDDSFVTVRANGYLLTNAFVNLIENNCKYSENKTSVVHISYWDSMTILRFSDNGLGMSEEDARNIFQPFRRGGNKGYAHGYGIGMALVKKIVDLHGGRIEVHSSVGEGTTFIVNLPHIVL